MSNKTNVASDDAKIALVYVVVSYGNIVGVYADSNEAFAVQMATLNKGRLCELVPKPVIYSENLKSL